MPREEPIVELEVGDGRIKCLQTASGEHRFDTLYSALGTNVRSELALALGATHDETGALTVDDHQRTSVPGLWAAGDVSSSLNQIAVAMGQAAIAAAIAATAIPSRAAARVSLKARSGVSWRAGPAET